MWKMIAFVPLPTAIPYSRLVNPHRYFRTAASSSSPLRRVARFTVVRCYNTVSDPTPRKSVAAVIIGNEILNGSTLDTNLSTLAKHVVARGAVLQHAVTIRDDVDTIADATRRLSAAHDLVFTSGGIGPTLDDVTYAGVAAAFSMRQRRHDPTTRRMKQVQPEMELNPARMRMANLPHDCETLWTDGLWVPLAVVRNVYVLPGIPKLFQRMLLSVPDERFGSACRRERRVVLCEKAEGDLAELLENVSQQYQQISLGSYPATTEEARKRYLSMITLEGDDSDDVAAAAEVVRLGVNGHYE